MSDRRLLSLGASVLVGVVLFVAVKLMMHPSTSPGDRVETRDCRWCGGTGQDQGDGEGEGMPRPTGGVCPGCRGAKKLRVILPGPNHPAMVKGTVRDEAQMGDMSVEAMALMQMQESHGPAQPVRGAVAGAKVVFQGGGQKLELTVPASGRFKALLTPGDYQVSVTAPGYQECRQTVHVRARVEPIWDEKAHLVTPESMEDVTYLELLLHK